jgi:hypothetical protein
MTQSGIEKEFHRLGTYREAFRQLDEGNHCAIVSEICPVYLRGRGLTVRAPVDFIRDVAEGVHLLLRWSGRAGELEIIELILDCAD